MDYMISVKDLGLAVFLIAGIIACVYLILLLRNLNESIKLVKGTLQSNKENIDNTLKDIPVITANLVDISNTAKGELKYVESAIHSMSEAAESTAAAASTVKNDFFGKIKGIIDLIDTLRKIFFKEKSTSTPEQDL